MEQQYKTIGFWLLTLLAEVTCNLHELDTSGPSGPGNTRSKLQRHIRSKCPGSTRSTPARSTFTHQLPQQFCNYDFSTKLNITLEKAYDEYINISKSIDSNRLREQLARGKPHFENLPYERHADRSVQNTIKDLFALKQHWDMIPSSDKGDLGMDLKRLMCSMAIATDVPSIHVTLPIVTDAVLSFIVNDHGINKFKYIVAKDISSYMDDLRTQSCVV